MHFALSLKPLHFRSLVKLASQSVNTPCFNQSETDCSLYREWISAQRYPGGAAPGRDAGPADLDIPVSVGDPFHDQIGVSSISIALKPPEFVSGAVLDDIDDSAGVAASAGRLLRPRLLYAAKVSRFAVVILLQLAMSPDIPLKADDYATKVHNDFHDFVRIRGSELSSACDDNNDCSFTSDLSSAVSAFESAARAFHSAYDTTTPALELLAHHEYSDQLMETERAFLAPASIVRGGTFPNGIGGHVLYGPDPLNAARAVLFPGVSAALEMTRVAEDKGAAVDALRREVFVVVNALNAAKCVLDNHLVWDSNH